MKSRGLVTPGFQQPAEIVLGRRHGAAAQQILGAAQAHLAHRVGERFGSDRAQAPRNLLDDRFPPLILLLA